MQSSFRNLPKNDTYLKNRFQSISVGRSDNLIDDHDHDHRNDKEEMKK